jgi:hypothetical protein
MFDFVKLVWYFPRGGSQLNIALLFPIILEEVSFSTYTNQLGKRGPELGR